MAVIDTEFEELYYTIFSLSLHLDKDSHFYNREKAIAGVHKLKLFDLNGICLDLLYKYDDENLIQTTN